MQTSHGCGGGRIGSGLTWIVSDSVRAYEMVKKQVKWSKHMKWSKNQ
jgi:hypothetical protein